ncbi:hypothetical protein [Halorientalis sp.]|jgi:hypothetical protein|uniref:hypothetical protein n=1 Tax=Halorientalis sp. TaxID=1931229 RepID=UPI002621A070|nr:hypothetical protein [Halorientalis sp.]
MLIHKRCSVCHDDVGPGDATICDACDNPIHERCASYEQQFNCPECADELDVGAVDF